MPEPALSSRRSTSSKRPRSDDAHPGLQLEGPRAPGAGGAEVWTHGVAPAWVATGHEVTLACSPRPASTPSRSATASDRPRWRATASACTCMPGVCTSSTTGKFDLVVDEINTVRSAPRSGPTVSQSSRSCTSWPAKCGSARRRCRSPSSVVTCSSPVGCADTGVPVFTPSHSTAASFRDDGIEHAIGASAGFGPPLELAGSGQGCPSDVRVRRSHVRDETAARRVAAFRIVQQHVPAARLWMIGTGPDEQTVRRHAGDGVEVLGAVTRHERDERMGRAHALVVTSVREGWGLVVSEAAAQGTGAIAYAVPGLIDSVRASGGVAVAPTIGALAGEMLPLRTLRRRRRFRQPREQCRCRGRLGAPRRRGSESSCVVPSRDFETPRRRAGGCCCWSQSWS